MSSSTDVIRLTENQIRNAVVLQGVSPEQLSSPEPLERLFAEKTLSYNAGIEHALKAVLDLVKVHPVRSNRRRRRLPRNVGRAHTKI